MKNYCGLLSILMLVLCSSGTSAQLSKEQKQKIDSLFISWNQPNHPGGAAGIMMDGKLIYSGAFGLASLEYLVPNTPDTRFNIASVSKQFTCMGIVLLHQQGKLSIDDEVRTYLPELPDFGKPVTIRHLIHHTSGMRSLHALLGMAGWRGDDSRTNADLFRFMKNQEDLNFSPGEEFLYCNTGYMLMADIIEKITGEKFADWMYANVFEPLGMVDTYVEDKYSRVVPVNATSYYGNSRSGYSRSVEYWGYVGSGNIHSNTADLLVWLSNFYDPSPGWEEAFELMKTRGLLNNGDTLDYAFGINKLRYKGQNLWEHGGSIGGYRSIVQAYPDHKLNIVVLTNFSSSGVGPKASGIADIVLGLESAEEEVKVISEADVASVSLPLEDLERVCGHYWNDDSRYARKIYLKDDTLRYFRSEWSENKLLPLAKDSFQMLGIPGRLTVKFDNSGKSLSKMSLYIEDGDPIVSRYFEPPVITKKLLEGYAGRYYSPELDTYYTLFVRGDTALAGNHVRHGDFGIRIIREDDLAGELGAFSGISVKRDKKQKIEGLLVTNGRVRNMWFRKE